MRWTNVLVGVVTLASALAVLGSDLFEPGYRQAHGDSLGLVVAYAAAQIGIIGAFWRDTRLVPWLALAKALVAYVFLLSFVPGGPYWIAWTPGRYVYQLFDWGEGTELVLFAMAYFGRGIWNTVNAFYFTAPWWRPLRIRRPLLGRTLTAVPMAAVILCVWMFVELVRATDAHDVARLVYGELDCATIRARAGETTTDLRQRGKRRYTVRIIYGCPVTRVLVADDGDHVGTVAGRRADCCGDGGASPPPSPAAPPE